MEGRGACDLPKSFDKRALKLRQSGSRVAVPEKQHVKQTSNRRSPSSGDRRHRRELSIIRAFRVDSRLIYSLISRSSAQICGEERYANSGTAVATVPQRSSQGRRRCLTGLAWFFGGFAGSFAFTDSSSAAHDPAHGQLALVIGKKYFTHFVCAKIPALEHGQLVTESLG